jgi:hypothetical protein
MWHIFDSWRGMMFFWIVVPSLSGMESIPAPLMPHHHGRSELKAALNGDYSSYGFEQFLEKTHATWARFDERYSRGVGSSPQSILSQTREIKSMNHGH